MLPVGGLAGATWFTNVCVFPEEAPIFGVVNTGDVASTTDPEPVTELICVPLILNTLPAPPVSKVLFVNVSVVARATKVSVLLGKVKVAVPAAAPKVFPLILIVFPPAVSMVLLLNVSVVVRPTSVSALLGSVSVPLADALALITVLPDVEPASVTVPSEPRVTLAWESGTPP